MLMDIHLSIFGKQFPISNPKIRRLEGSDFKLSGDFKGVSATYRRINTIWINAEGSAIDPMFAAFFDSVVERAEKLALV